MISSSAIITHRPSPVGFLNGKHMIPRRLPLPVQSREESTIFITSSNSGQPELEASVSGKDTNCPDDSAGGLGWGTAALGMFGFSAVAYDVFGEQSLHLLQPLDDNLHRFSQSLDPVVVELVFRQCISNSAIYTGLLGWIISSVIIMASSENKATHNRETIGKTSDEKVLLLSWGFYASLAGGLLRDPWVVSLVKDSFHRLRPSPVLSSFSFPSGHTISATFLVASLLFVLIPMVLRRKPEGLGIDPSPLISMQKASWQILGLAWAVTATGRVIGDAHWFSDTLAAGFFAMAAASVLSKCSDLLMTLPSKAQEKSFFHDDRMVNMLEAIRLQPEKAGGNDASGSRNSLQGP